MKPSIALVMGGGAALGAFHAGAYEALSEHGLEPDWVAGSSTGAITAALIAGNAPKDRVEALNGLWEAASVFPLTGGRVGRDLALLNTVLFGRPGFFAPMLPKPSPYVPFGGPGLFEMSQLVGTLEKFADFSLANATDRRLVVHTTDLVSGEAMVFDSFRAPVEPLHILASCALPMDFAPVMVDGRWLCDGGMSSNLPLRDIVEPMPDRPMICFAIDLFCKQGSAPISIDGMGGRCADLLLASQAEKDVELAAQAWKASPVPILLAHLRHDGEGEMIGQKMFDFSAEAIALRWRAGKKAMEEVLENLPPLPEAGLVQVGQAPSDGVFARQSSGVDEGRLGRRLIKAHPDS